MMTLNYYEVVVLANAKIERHGVCTRSPAQVRHRFNENFRVQGQSHHKVVRVLMVDRDRWSELVFGNAAVS